MILATAAAWRAQRHDHAQLIEALTPEQPETPAPAVVLQVRRNVEARNALLADFGAPLVRGQEEARAGRELVC